MGAVHYFHIQHVAEELGADPVTTDPGILEGWEIIREEVEALPVPHKVYNDSYSKYNDDGPVEMIKPTGVIEIDLFLEPIGPNKDLLIYLSKRGSVIVRCESNELVETYRDFMTTVLHNYLPDETLSDCDKTRYSQIICARNEFVAKQIGESLMDSETGMLFLGRFHDLGDYMTDLLTALGINVIHHFKHCLPRRNGNIVM
ncbi:MAG: hypothetical protein NTW27_02930 [Deltaproteobacteria bacterium]|nr:hypothetical protein [Deltaproteobacteria bacterium]